HLFFMPVENNLSYSARRRYLFSAQPPTSGQIRPSSSAWSARSATPALYKTSMSGNVVIGATSPPKPPSPLRTPAKSPSGKLPRPPNAPGPAIHIRTRVWQPTDFPPATCFAAPGRLPICSTSSLSDQVRSHDADELAGRDHLRLLPEPRKMPLVAGHQLIGAGGIGALQELVVVRV